MHKHQVIINGAFGKMGVLATKAIQNHDQFQVIKGLGRNDNLAQTLQDLKPDLVVDLTRADAVFANAKVFMAAQIPFVIGTSGLSLEQTEEIANTCAEIQLGGLIVPNFSIGAILTSHFATLAAPWFDGVEIVEMHHAQKADSPSATALHTAQEIHAIKPNWPNSKPTPGREYFHHQIPIHAIRMPGLLALQQIILGQKGETIQLQHQIIDREAYMPGLLLACEKVLTLNHLHIGLEPWLLREMRP